MQWKKKQQQHNAQNNKHKPHTKNYECRVNK